MSKQASKPLWVLAVLTALLPTLSGCSSGPGGPFSGFVGLNRLTRDAKDLREASGPPAGTPRELDKQAAGPYIIEPGDALLAQPASLDSPLRLPGDQVVLPDGTIQLGQFGHLSVAGKTLVAVEAEVNSFIKSKMADAGTIVVRLVTRDSKVYYVLGDVNAPGAFPLKGRETVLDAIVAAGGLNSNGSRRKIILSRPTGPNSCRIVLPVCYNDIVQLGDTTTNYQIQAGDRVFVPTKTIWEDLCHEKGACPPPTTCVPRDGEAIAPKGRSAVMSPAAVIEPPGPHITGGSPVSSGPPVPLTPPPPDLPPPSAAGPLGTLPPDYRPLQPPGS